jgi:Mor family transcriptional regulator
MERPPVNLADSPPTASLSAGHTASLLPDPPENDGAALLRSDIREVVRHKIGMTEPFADLISEAILQGLRERWGGREIYVPAEDTAERNRRIRQAWRGNNASEVMLRFGISKATLYRVLNDR